MPGPFPGMDPYLENPAFWPGLHQALITHIRAALNAVLPRTYVADIGERLYVVQPGRDILPDAVVVQHPAEAPEGGGTAVAIRPHADPAWIFQVEPSEVREVFVEILALGEGGRVVTVIELPSPTNKDARSEGGRLYRRKQREVLDSDVSLLEIDLLRDGDHTVAAPYDALTTRGTWDYLVSLHRGGPDAAYEVWPIHLQGRLPRIIVPLAGEHADLVVDLQPLFDRSYEEGAYDRRQVYDREPRPPLSDADRKWAAELLRACGVGP